MEIEINGHEYRATKLSVFDQLKVTRKLLPVLSGLTGELQKLQQGEMPMAAVLPVMANAIAQMSDEDCNAILHPCLAVVSRKNAKAWTPIFRQGELMFDDIDLKTLLEIVAQVIGDSLGNFFRTPRRRDSQPPTTGLTLDSMPDGKDFLRLPVKYGYIKFDKLKDGSIDLADLAEMNEWIDIEQDNKRVA